MLSSFISRRSNHCPASLFTEGWSLGIKDRMTKWLNPDATTADLGEGMQAYYDEKRKVWVFPGEDPDEKVKPLTPPPTAAKMKTETLPPQNVATPIDPLAAMMAPPSRRSASMIRRSSSVMSKTESGTSQLSSGPGAPPIGMPPIIMPLGAAPPSLGGGGPPPRFTVFKPAPVTAAEEEPDADEE